MDLFGRKARRRKREAAKANLDAYHATLASESAARRERARQQTAAAEKEYRRRHDAIDDVQNRQLTDTQMTTNMGAFETGIVLDGGAHHEHQHQDPPSPPPPAFDSGSDSGSSYDSGSSDSSSGSDFSGGSDF